MWPEQYKIRQSLFEQTEIIQIKNLSEIRAGNIFVYGPYVYFALEDVQGRNNIKTIWLDNLYWISGLPENSGYRTFTSFLGKVFQGTSAPGFVEKIYLVKSKSDQK